MDDLERVIRQLLVLAEDRDSETNDPYKKERLRTGINLAENILALLDAVRPVVTSQCDFITRAWEEGGLFDGNNGRFGGSV